jgi:hypothetical protein
MTRKSITLALICNGLVAALGCSPAPSAHVPHPRSFHPITSGVALGTIITSDKGGMPALRISLKNVAEMSISIETGQAFYPVILPSTTPATQMERTTETKPSKLQPSIRDATNRSRTREVSQPLHSRQASTRLQHGDAELCH